MPLPLLIVVASWTAFLVTWLVSSFSVKRDLATGGSWQTGLLTRVVAIVGIAVLWRLAGLGPLPERTGLLFHGWSPALASILGPVGAAICVAGVALAIWARLHLGANWSSHPTLKEGHQLVTSGPYALIRHPIYTGIIVAMVGSALVALPWIVALIGGTVVFVWRVRKEEDLMMRQFPSEYPAYRARTWALIPWVW